MGTNGYPRKVFRTINMLLSEPGRPGQKCRRQVSQRLLFFPPKILEDAETIQKHRFLRYMHHLFRRQVQLMIRT